MVLEQAMIGALTRKVVDAVLARLTKAVERGSADGITQGLVSADGLDRHIRLVLNWSDAVRDIESSMRADVEQTTVPLQIVPEIRRLGGFDGTHPRLAEQALLMELGNGVLLGDPGAGKTTTLKRLAKALLNQVPDGYQDGAQYPVLIVVREMEPGQTLFRMVAEQLGIVYEQREKVSYIAQQAPRGAAPDAPKPPPLKHVEIEDWVGGKLLSNVLIDYLNETGALLLIDGLDEARSEDAQRLVRDMEKLGSHLRAGRILVSCRVGSFTRHFESFNTYQICPLTPAQIETVARMRLGTMCSAFLAELTTLPYTHLADRPLFLNYLIVVFRKDGCLPPQPVDIYRKIVRLMLEEWDKQRDVQRKTAYAGFDADRKREFLSAIAYSLTYRRKQHTFSEADLLALYDEHCFRYDLPAGEALQVAREIESHSGLIVEASNASWEFSHLSLQEYLCGEYLVRSPVTDAMAARLADHTAPLAIAVALAPQSSEWLAYLVLQSNYANEWNFENSYSFLSRLSVERPRFQRSKMLGQAFLKLFHKFRSGSRVDGVTELLLGMCRQPEIAASIQLALKHYRKAPSAELIIDGLVEVEHLPSGQNEALAPQRGAYPRVLEVAHDESLPLSDASSNATGQMP